MFGFPNNLVRYLACQKDGGPLFSESSDEIIANGFLTCKICAEKYEIIDGIAHLMHPQWIPDHLTQTEISSRNKEAARYDKKLTNRYHKEVPTTLKLLSSSNKDIVIEYGAGTGRLTIPIAKTGAHILAIDFSRKSLEELREKLGSSTEVGLIVGDIVSFRTPSQVFSRAIAAQVYEHIPTAQKRRQFLLNICHGMKADAFGVLTFYHQDLRRKFSCLPKEGTHSSGIFYHYFSASEARREIHEVFKIDRLSPIDITLPLETRLFISKTLGGLISRIVERFPFINSFGHLLACRFHKKPTTNI